MTVDNARHVVISACIGWGHLRGLCMLSSRFVKLRPSINVTFFTSRLSYDKVQAEISRDFDEHEKHLRDKVHVIALVENQENPLDMNIIDQSFIEQYRKLVKLEEVWCAKKEITVATSGGRAPDTVILDLFAYSQFLAVRKAHPDAKILCWSPAPTSGIIPILGPFGSDTKGLLARKTEERMRKTGEPFMEAAYNALAVGLSDKPVEVPGLPVMYDHEAAPQKMPSDAFRLAPVFHIDGADFYHDADGVITPTFAAFDPPESMQAMREFFALNNRKFYVVGPLVPSPAAENAEKNELRQSPKSRETEAFLGRVLETHGEKSLVYVSFGSMFWSSEPEKIWAFVDTLLEKKIPFIMAHASPFAHVPAEIHQKVESSGLGLLTPWAPQQLILNSPVIGWFVTHCGVNSIIETISAGVPMIAWPFGAEQPYNAIHCSLTLNIAYELLEVRTGNSLKVYRTGKTHPGTVEDVRAEAAAVLDKAFGPDGEVKRKNILKLREAAEQAWAEGGPGRTAVEELLAGL